MHTNEQPTYLSYSHVPQSEHISLNLFVWYNFSNIISKRWQYTHKEVLAKVFVDKQQF